MGELRCRWMSADLWSDEQVLCGCTAGYLRPHVRLFDFGWRDPSLTRTASGLTADYGNDPVGLITRFANLLGHQSVPVIWSHVFWRLGARLAPGVPQTLNSCSRCACKLHDADTKQGFAAVVKATSTSCLPGDRNISHVYDTCQW